MSFAIFSGALVVSFGRAAPPLSLMIFDGGEMVFQRDGGGAERLQGIYDLNFPFLEGQRPHGAVGADSGHHGPGRLHGRRVLHHLRREGSPEEVLHL